MAEDKEAISLWRVYSYDSISVLILCVTRLNEILVNSVLEHIDTGGIYTTS